MDNFYEFADFQQDGPDPEQDATDFEQKIEEGSNFYMDPSTIDEVFEYYRATQANDKALKLLGFAIDRFPFRSEYYFKKSQVEYELGNLGMANNDIAHALEIQPYEAEYMLQRVRILFGQKREREALATLQSILDYAEETADLYYQLGVVCQHAEHHTLAVEYFKNALKLEPQYEDPVYEIIYCHEQQGQTEASIQFCQTFLDDNPYSAVGWYNLGMLYHKMGLYENAVRALDFAVLIDEYFISAYHGKGLSLMVLGRSDEAVRVFLEALHCDNRDAATLLALAECFEELEDTQRARFYYMKLKEVFPTLPDAWLGIAATLETEGRFYDAVHFYKHALTLDENLCDAYMGLAWCEYEVGNYLSAYEALSAAIRLNADDTEMFHEWAERLADDNRLETALDLLEQGIRNNPKAYSLAYQYAVYAFMAGRSVEAFVYLENALLMDFEQHKLLYAYNDRIAKMRPIQELIAQYQPR